MNYNFAEATKVVPPTNTMSVSLSVVGANTRFLTTTGTLDVSGAVRNTGSQASGNFNWSVASSSPGLQVAPTAVQNLAPGNSTSLSGAIVGSSLSPGTQSATLSISGNNSSTGAAISPVSTSVTIDPVEPRNLAVISGGASSPITVPSTLGGLLYGAVAPVNNFLVTSTNANPDSYHTTVVNVGTATGQVLPATDPTGSVVGQVTVGPALVDGSQAYTAVPLSVAAGNWGPVVSASAPVA